MDASLATNAPGSRVPTRSARRDHESRFLRVIDAHRRLREAAGGRAWINGRETGGPDPRYRHLAKSYD